MPGIIDNVRKELHQHIDEKTQRNSQNFLKKNSVLWCESTCGSQNQ